MYRVYIAGRVTGEPAEAVRQKFATAQKLLENNGQQAINPVNIVPEGTAWLLAMKICIKSLVTCDAIYLLPCYLNSKGAKLELKIAKSIGLTIMHHVTILKD